jgi:hypothetical protein
MKSKTLPNQRGKPEAPVNGGEILKLSKTCSQKIKKIYL